MPAHQLLVHGNERLLLALKFMMQKREFMKPRFYHALLPVKSLPMPNLIVVIE